MRNVWQKISAVVPNELMTEFLEFFPLDDSQPLSTSPPARTVRATATTTTTKAPTATPSVAIVLLPH